MKNLIIFLALFFLTLPSFAQRHGGGYRSSYGSSKHSSSTKEYRYVPPTVKYDMRREAGFSPRDRNAIIDHKVPLELGGSNKRSNLQVQTRPPSIKKDRLENQLTREVKTGKISLPEAQRKINQGPVKQSQLRSSSKSKKP